MVGIKPGSNDPQYRNINSQQVQPRDSLTNFTVAGVTIIAVPSEDSATGHRGREGADIPQRFREQRR